MLKRESIIIRIMLKVQPLWSLVFFPLFFVFVPSPDILRYSRQVVSQSQLINQMIDNLWGMFTPPTLHLWKIYFHINKTNRYLRYHAQSKGILNKKWNEQGRNKNSPKFSENKRILFKQVITEGINVILFLLLLLSLLLTLLERSLLFF